MIVFVVDAWYVRVPDLAEAYAVNWILSDYLSELGNFVFETPNVMRENR